MKTQPKNPESLISEQKKVLMEFRGRRASRLGEQIFEDPSIDEDLRFRALAAGHEAYLRELISKGHEEQARNRVTKLLLDTPDLKKYWALSLQLRWGLTEAHTEDLTWVARLRSELVDPSDLLQVESAGINEQASTLIQAWELIEQGSRSEALTLLKTIGRRSPLVDWRLFLQILIELHKGNKTERETFLSRMQVGSPAHGAALRAADVEKTDNQGPVFKRLAALEKQVKKGVLPVGEYPKLQQELLRLLKENRPGMAITLAATIGNQLSSRHEINRLYDVFLKCSSPLFSLNKVYLRMAYDEDPAILLESESLKELRNENWSKAELACVWPEVFKQATLYWMELEQDEDDGEREFIYSEMIDPLVNTCKKLTKIIPQCRDLYEFWLWAVNKMSLSQHAALVAFAHAFPDDKEVLKRAVLGLVDQGEAESQAQILARLKEQLPADPFEAFQQTLLITKLRLAFQNNNRSECQKLAATYSGTDLMEQIEVAFVLWRFSYRGKKSKLGATLNAFKLPWLVFYVGCTLDPSLRVRMLPAALKRALSDDPNVVLEGVTKLLEIDESKAMKLAELHLLEPIISALDHPETSIETLRRLMPVIFQRFQAADELIWNSPTAFLQAFRTLLSGEPNDQALAIGLRLMIPILADYRIKEEQSKRSFRVAWTLADEATRKLLYRIHSKCGFPQRQFPQEIAAKKMIDAELKMQHKFSDENQVIRRYVIEGTINEDEIGNIDNSLNKIREMIENMSPEEFQAQVSALVELAGLDPNHPYLDPEDYEDGENGEDWGDREEVIKPPKSKPYIFSPHAPTMELEFDRIIANVKETTQGQHRMDAIDHLIGMCLQAKISENARSRVLFKIEQLKSER